MTGLGNVLSSDSSPSEHTEVILDPSVTRPPVSQCPMPVLLSDRVLDGVLGFLLVRATLPGGDTSVENLARWDLKAALTEVLGREGIRA